MIILKIIGIIIAVLLCLLLIVFHCPVNIRLWTDQEKKVKFAVKFLFININNQKEKTPEKSAKSPDKKDSLLKLYFKKYGFCDTVSKISEILSDGLRELSFILHRTRFKKIYLTILCATNDASKTALSYGRICSAVYPVTAILDNEFRVSKDAFDINIGCDFNTDKFDWSFDFEVSLMSFSAVISAIKLFRKYRKLF